jgi:ATP:cob(I)alamin adenosyltransferase
MKRVYTRSGDKGTTAIHGGQRVDKDDIRIEANGTLDELNVSIGIVRSLMDLQHPWQPILFNIQLTLMSLMSIVATPNAKRASNPNRLSDDLVDDIERGIDQITAQSGEAEYLILPGGSHVSAQLHMARVVARRAERRLWSLNRVDPVPENILKYINRLSDLFFVMARAEMLDSGMAEERWRSFCYRKQR